MEWIRFKHFKKALTCQPFFIWHDLGVEELDVDDINFNFWSEDLIEADTSVGQVIAKTFGLFEAQVREAIQQEFATVTLSGPIEQRINQTQELLSSNKVIINPIFEYEGVIASPFAFDTKNNRIFNINYSGKTKRLNFLKAFYDVNLLKALGIEVNDYFIYLPQNIRANKNQVTIHAINVCNSTKLGDYPEAIDAKNKLKAIKIIDALKTKSTMISWPDFINTINLIKESKEASISNNLIKDVTYWGENKQWNLLLEHLDHPLAGYVGHIQKKVAIASKEPIQSTLYQKLKKLKNPTIFDQDYVFKIIKQLEVAKRVIWYDFEGFALPFAAIDQGKPYRQVVFQVSIIQTSQLKEQAPINKVYDPKTLNKDDFFNIIETVYQDHADLYVVYNKGYENARLKEMVELLFLEKDLRAKKAKKMYEHIVEHTLDLYNLFAIRSGNALPPILLPDQKGKSSIKNIEKYINTHNLSSKIGYQIKPYQSLVIQKGTMAMDVAIRRALNIIDENEWQKVFPELKIYCENDVRAMIMVYYFIKYIIKTYVKH